MPHIAAGKANGHGSHLEPLRLQVREESLNKPSKGSLIETVQDAVESWLNVTLSGWEKL
jgi:hypothetical protein